jgi:hypothetical protein
MESNNSQDKDIINNMDMDDNIDMEMLFQPVLKRETYDYLPSRHASFESWKNYVTKHGDKDGLVFGFSLNDWSEEYAHDYFDDFDIAFPTIPESVCLPISIPPIQDKELKQCKLNIVNISFPQHSDSKKTSPKNDKS